MTRNRSRKRWSEQEKEMLKELHEKYGEKCWNHVSNHIEGRQPKDARQVWRYHMKEQLQKTPLTNEEKQLLKDLHEEKKMGWSEMESYFSNRDQIRLRNEYMKMKRHERKHNSLYLVVKQKEIKQEETNLEEQNYFCIEDSFGMFDDWFSSL
jgi:hypothetical protein